MTGWAILLQWSRVAICALVFLLAARMLLLDAIGAFATAFAVVRLTQVVHKAGLAELAIISDAADRPLFVLSLWLGVGLTLLCLGAAFLLPSESCALLLAMAVLPLLNGLSALSEGRLRRAMRLRALALRTLSTQIGAAGLTLWALSHGYGAWSLVVFALANGLLTATITLALCPPRLSDQDQGQITPLIPTLVQLTLRALAGSSTLPAVQLLVSVTLGLPAAGAFQIAARITELVDALALAPLRYIALPRFKDLAGGAQFGPALRRSLLQVTLLTALIYPLAWLAAPFLLPLLGADKAAETMPLLAPLLCWGALAALLMPLTQALTALGHTSPPLRRTFTALVLSVAFLALAPGAFWALPLAALLAALPFLYVAKQTLFLPNSLKKASL